MPSCQTKHHGEVEYDRGAVIEFPEGLLGFESETRFLALEPPGWRPIVLLQSLTTPDLCFLSLPVLVVDPHYHLAISPEDLACLELPRARQPRIGEEVLCLALITLRPDQPATANLLAPVIVNLKSRHAVQGISMNPSLSHQYAFLPASEEEAVCL